MRTVIVIAALAVAASGCYRATVETGRQASGQTISVAFAHSFLIGLIPPSTVSAAQRCPNGVARVQTVHTFPNLLVQGITFGLYSPMSIRVDCAAAGGGDEGAAAGAAAGAADGAADAATGGSVDGSMHGASTMVSVPAGTSAEDVRRIMSEAVLASAERGEAVFFSFR